MFGLGGIFVEIFRDVRFRVAPVGPATAAEMVREIRAFRMLAGARGKARRDVGAIEECLQRLSVMATDCSMIAEMDINPLIVADEGRGAFVADARILLQQ
jgi:acyl-CoA synthetase (NDP forming)